MAVPKEDRPLGELFGELSQQTSALVQKEIQLAKHEMVRSASNIARDLALVAAGAAIAYAGFLGLMFAVVVILAVLGVPLWASALLVGVIVTAVGVFLALRSAKALGKEKLVPERTIETLKDDARWAKEQTK